MTDKTKTWTRDEIETRHEWGKWGWISDVVVMDICLCVCYMVVDTWWPQHPSPAKSERRIRERHLSTRFVHDGWSNSTTDGCPLDRALNADSCTPKTHVRRLRGCDTRLDGVRPYVRSVDRWATPHTTRRSASRYSCTRVEHSEHTRWPRVLVKESGRSSGTTGGMEHTTHTRGTSPTWPHGHGDMRAGIGGMDGACGEHAFTPHHCLCSTHTMSIDIVL